MNQRIKTFGLLVIALAMIGITVLAVGAQLKPGQIQAQQSIVANFQGWGRDQFQGHPTARICMELPSVADWIFDAEVVVGDQTMQMLNWGLVNAKDPKTSASASRCYDVGFEEAALNAMTRKDAQIQVKLSGFHVNYPDIITQAHCDAASARLIAKASPVKFSCVPHSDTGGLQIKIDSYPKDLTSDQATNAVSDALTPHIDQVVVIDTPRNKGLAVSTAP